MYINVERKMYWRTVNVYSSLMPPFNKIVVIPLYTADICEIDLSNKISRNDAISYWEARNGEC